MGIARGEGGGVESDELDLELPLDQAAAGYEAMDTRQAIKVLLRS